MIIFGELGVATKKLINQFLNEWWDFDEVSYNQYHKRYKGIAENMVEYLKYNEPVVYDYVLEALEEWY